MTNYLKSAIATIYGKDDDFILLGLTGRTGSGCSTVAQILQSEMQNIKHSLFAGDNPDANEYRKQKIIRNHFEKTWEPFRLIQVRSVLTLLLVESGISEAMEFVQKIDPKNDKQKMDELQIHFELIYEKFNDLKSIQPQITCEQFYT